MAIKSIVYLQTNIIEELGAILATGYLRLKGIQIKNPDGSDRIAYEPEILKVVQNEEKPLCLS
jgi:hypothetical protein